MKRLMLAVLAVLVLTFAVTVHATEWHTANQSTISWSASTKLMNSGAEIPAGDTLFYRIYESPDVDGFSEVNEVANRVDGTTYTINFNAAFKVEGQHIIGVQVVRIPEGRTLEKLSPITWSNVVTADFGFLHYEVPEAVPDITVED